MDRMVSTPIRMKPGSTKKTAVGRTRKSVENLCVARTDAIQTESTYFLNMYKIQTKLLEIKKQNALMKQLY